MINMKFNVVLVASDKSDRSDISDRSYSYYKYYSSYISHISYISIRYIILAIFHFLINIPVFSPQFKESMCLISSLSDKIQ